MNCTNCKKAFTCGCQKTKASDRSTIHKTCVAAYEAKLRSKK